MRTFMMILALLNALLAGISLALGAPAFVTIINVVAAGLCGTASIQGAKS